jgi:glycosyltransferase involved in cell wall biosynthesis
VPLVSFVLAVHDGARYLGSAVHSVLGQTVQDLELIVIDDASSDETPDLLAAVGDRRLVVLRNDKQAGLAASLNRGLETASGRYVARLDDDDVAVPERLERQLARIRADPRVAVVGSAVVDLDADGEHGHTHRLPTGGAALRWHALFSSPFFHPTVLVDRETLDRHGLRYDAAFLESEDYDLWTRVFAFADGANLSEPLVEKRVHPGQASLRRSELQQSFQRQVALREIARLAPGLDEEKAELAWGFGSGRIAPTKEGGNALLELLAAFEREHGRDRRVREAAGRALLRGRRFRNAAKLIGRRGRRQASGDVLRVTVVSPEPTPYRAPLFDCIAARADVDLTVIYAARSVAHRAWTVEPTHRHVFLRGVAVPGAERFLRHQYPLTPGVAGALRRAQPDVVVVSGWSTFASQRAIAWCRTHGVPYVLLVESHDLGPRTAWRRAIKGAVVPRLLWAAANVLVVGSAARESVVARGATSVRLFANTIDVAAWTTRAQQLERRRPDDDVLVLSVARLVPEKGIDDLIRAVAEAADPRLRLVVAGAGPQRETLIELAAGLGVRLTILGHVAEAELARLYVDADVFALLSRHEPWGVAVNEAAASGLPLLLSDRVGAVSDLLADGQNGFLVPAGDVQGAAAALQRLAADPALRHELGTRSRELVRDWGYESSVDNFVAAVREATSR